MAEFARLLDTVVGPVESAALFLRGGRTALMELVFTLPDNPHVFCMPVAVYIDEPWHPPYSVSVYRRANLVISDATIAATYQSYWPWSADEPDLGRLIGRLAIQDLCDFDKLRALDLCTEAPERRALSSCILV